MVNNESSDIETRKQGWTKEEIDMVLEDAKSKDYDHLLQVLMTYTTSENTRDDSNEYDEEFEY